MVISHLARLEIPPGSLQRFRVVHPSMLSGVETDIAVVAPSLLGRPDDPRVIEGLAVLLAGRARYRLEMCLEFQDSGKPDPLSLYLAQMFGWQYDTIVDPATDGPLAQLADLLRDQGYTLREGLSQILVLNRGDLAPVAALNPVGESLREALHRRAVLAARQWRVEDFVAAMLTDSYNKESQEVKEVLSFLEGISVRPERF
jgi:hypothetical protein